MMNLTHLFTAPISTWAKISSRLGATMLFLLLAFSGAQAQLSNPSACQLGLVLTDNNCPAQDVFQINVASAPGTMLGTDVIVSDVDIIVGHTWVSDLEIELVSPNGVIVPLTSGNGGSGDNYGNPTDPTCTQVTNFNMTGANGPITGGVAPFIGSYIPEGNFATFNDNSNPVGLWELRICDSAGGDIGTLQYVAITLAPPPMPCTGTPVPGNTLSSANPVCSGVNFTLSLSGSPISGLGITYQWQSSPDGTTWTDITGATNATHTANQTMATFYQCIVTCTDSGLSANSTPLEVTMNPSSCQCGGYCIPTSTGTACVTNVTFNAINNTTAGCAPGNYSLQGATTNVETNSTYAFSVTTDASAIVSVWIDYNQDGTFDATEWAQVYTTGTTGTINITIPGGATLGETRMRVRSRLSGNPNGSTDACILFGSGEAEDYCITIIAGSNCAGTPAPGNTLSSANPACSGVGFTLSLSGSPISGTGITYQWQNSPDGTTWTDITGATNATYTTNQTTATFYQCIVTCTNSGLSANSTPLEVTMDVPANCYCAAGATNINPNFEKISRVEFNTIDNTSTSAAGYENFTAVSTTVDQGGTYSFTATISNPFSPDQILVWIDFNQDGDFDDAGEDVYVSGIGIGPHTDNIIILPTALTGPTRMRVRLHDSSDGPNTTPCGNSTYGQVEDYTLIIQVGTPCAGTPAPGNTLSSANPVCSGEDFTLTLSGSPISESGITYQWQSSPDGTTWTDITGATNATHTANQTMATFYQCIVTCTNSGLSANSTPLEVTMDAITNCYCSSNATFVDDTKIDSVFFNTISVGTDPTVCEAYTDNTAVSTTVTPGGTYPITIVNGSCSGSHFAAWVAVYIDYNQNGDFTDPGEDAYTFGPTTGLNTIPVGNITIPGTATLGTTRMRIVFAEGTSAPPPCGTYSLGETEDYTLNIQSCTPTAWYPDSDNDTYGDAVANPVMDCVAPMGFVADNTDCDDTNPAINPGAMEICNGIDDDCSGSPEAATNTWTGMGMGNSWDDPANWSDGIVPLSCQNVVIPSTGNVTIPAAFEGKGLTLEVATGAILTMQPAALLHIINP